MVWNPDLIGHFADIKTLKFGNFSSLFMRCYNAGKGFNKEAFGELLSAGASPHERDDEGRTCLHICISYLNPHSNKVDCLREFHAIKYLVKSGADPFATSGNGFAVAEYAYINGFHRAKQLGGYAGDLWDAVMRSCGFEISQFRTKKFRRRARYTQRYTRRHFEWLWEDRETECPYWDDEPWPPLEPGEIDSEDDRTSDEDESYIADDELDSHEREPEDEDDELNSRGSESPTEHGYSYPYPPSDELGNNTQPNDNKLHYWETVLWPPFQHQNPTELGHNNAEDAGGTSQTMVSELMNWGSGGHENWESGEQEEQQTTMAIDDVPWDLDNMDLENPWIN
jgi:hypothetical protein